MNIAAEKCEPASWVRAIVRAAADFVLPPACRMCDCELPDSKSGRTRAVFCAECETALAATHERACLRCGASIGPGLNPELPCAYCHDEAFAFQRVFRLGVYDGPLRSACREIKQSGTESLAAALAELTWQLEGKALAAWDIDVVIPVPQYWMQRFSRRHHAAETLAQVWAKCLQVPFAPHILRKIRWTKPQARLTPSERRTNLRQAFAAAGRQPLLGARVLLADDVMTTGTTAQEAARQLRRAGARQVAVAVIARGLGRRSQSSPQLGP